MRAARNESLRPSRALLPYSSSQIGSIAWPTLGQWIVQVTTCTSITRHSSPSSATTPSNASPRPTTSLTRSFRLRPRLRGRTSRPANTPAARIGIAAWGKLGEWAVCLTKGAHVQIAGELRSRDYVERVSAGEKSKKTIDVKRRVWEIRVDSILKLDRAERDKADTGALLRAPLWNHRGARASA